MRRGPPGSSADRPAASVDRTAEGGRERRMPNRVDFNRRMSEMERDLH